MIVMFEKYKEYMESEEGQRKMKEYFDNWAAEQDEITAYFESPEFNQLFKKLYDYLQLHPSVADDEYEGYSFEDVTNEQFYKLANSIYHNLGEFCGIDGCSEWIVYKGIKFETIHGQGSFTVASLWNPDEVKEQIDARNKEIEQLQNKIKEIQDEIAKIKLI
jgi:hypothetical protein